MDVMAKADGLIAISDASSDPTQPGVVVQAKQLHLHQDASPAEVQATQDRLQTHEHHVSMLQLALAACGELTAGREALEATRLQQRSAELEGPHHERVVAAASALVEECRRVEEELEQELLTAGASNEVRSTACLGILFRAAMPAKGVAVTVSVQGGALGLTVFSTNPHARCRTWRLRCGRSS